MYKDKIYIVMYSKKTKGTDAEPAAFSNPIRYY